MPPSGCVDWAAATAPSRQGPNTLRWPSLDSGAGGTTGPAPAVAWRLLALAVAPCAAASAARDRADARAAATLQRSLDRVVVAGVPGAVLLVRDGDRTIRLTAGNATLRPKRPMRAGDRFRVGSITKPFVATVVLQLVAEHRLALEDTVARWLPGLVPGGERITVRQPLTHTSGLFPFGGDRDFVAQAFRDPRRMWAPREIVAIGARHRPTFAPGAGWSYSDTNYFVLGLIVERATGHPLATELARRILGPLRLRATRLPTGPPRSARADRARAARPGP